MSESDHANSSELMIKFKESTARVFTPQFYFYNKPITEQTYNNTKTSFPLLYDIYNLLRAANIPLPNSSIHDGMILSLKEKPEFNRELHRVLNQLSNRYNQLHDVPTVTRKRLEAEIRQAEYKLSHNSSSVELNTQLNTRKARLDAHLTSEQTKCDNFNIITNAQLPLTLIIDSDESISDCSHSSHSSEYEQSAQSESESDSECEECEECEESEESDSYEDLDSDDDDDECVAMDLERIREEREDRQERKDQERKDRQEREDRDAVFEAGELKHAKICEEARKKRRAEYERTRQE
ncbi:MAG: hypothetical protein JKX96_11255 [Acinetobacter sp.]|nr:hypothetical protein [Acinetobacter sp.]MBL4861386.1 hypothetical protein [Acinetobacter sp.]